MEVNEDEVIMEKEKMDEDVYNFSVEKQKLLSELSNNENNQPDKSRAGKVDEAIRSLVDTINDSSDYYTTSSCAGRIILVQSTPGVTGYADMDWLFVSHNTVKDSSPIEEALKTIKHEKGSEVWLNMEAFIVAICARNVASAQKLLDVCRTSAGLKRCCITGVKQNRVIMALMDTQRIETLVAKDGKTLVSNEYLDTLIQIANEKLNKTRQRMKRLEDSFRSQFLNSNSNNETEQSKDKDNLKQIQKQGLPKKEYQMQKKKKPKKTDNFLLPLFLSPTPEEEFFGH